MDKELLRSVIIATGMIIMLIMVTWGYLSNKRLQAEWAEEDELAFNNKTQAPLEDVEDHLDDNLDDEYPTETIDQHYYDKDDAVLEPTKNDVEPTPRFSIPAVIQFSLMAKAKEGFNGVDLANAFAIVGLEYGSLRIYERIDSKRLVDFGVVSMLGTGVFPHESIDNFYCPGLIFFMQPGQLNHARQVFEDFIETIEIVAIELDGTILDHNRQLLTDDTIHLFHQSL